MAITRDEELARIDKAIDDEEFTALSEAHENYEIDVNEYWEKREKIFAEYGVEHKPNTDFFSQIKRLNKLWTIDEDFTMADYDRMLKRTLKDIEEYAYYKGQQDKA